MILSLLFWQDPLYFFISLLQTACTHISVVHIVLKAKVAYGEKMTECGTAEFVYNFAVPAELICDFKVAANS